MTREVSIASGIGEIVEATDIYLKIQSLEKEIHFLKSVIEDLPGSIYWKDRNGVYLGHNAFAKKMMEYYIDFPGTIVGKTDFDLFPKATAEAYRQHDLEVMNSDRMSIKEETAVLPNGETLIQLSYKRALKNEAGEVIGVIGNTIDITYLKKIEQELREAKEKAEKADQAKTDFMRHMEHDIRTPFNGIWVLAKMLAAKETDSEKKQCLEDITTSAKQLLDYCNDILDSVKIEAGITPVASKKIDLQALLNNVVLMLKVAANNKHLKLTLEYSPELPSIVVGDPNRLQRILLNLTSNAIKFTAQGYVKISARVAKLIDSRNLIAYFIVEDTGVGLHPAQQEYIYEKIPTIASAIPMGYKGYGLGLPVVKQLINELNAEIDVKSELGKGTIFTCTIPLGDSTG